MAKTKTPFFSMGAQGSVGRSVTAQKTASSTLLRGKPLPTDPYSLPQAYQRWLYEDYAYLWTKQTNATKAEYRRAAVRFHLTAFQYWMKYHLKTQTDIIGVWHLDEKAGAVAYDSSLNQNHGTIFGATPTSCAINGAFSFDSTNDSIRLPTVDILEICAAGRDCSVEVYIQTTINKTNNIIISKYGAPGWMFFLDNQVARFFMYQTGTKRRNVLGTSNMTDGEKHHLLATNDFDGSLLLYVDGLREGAPDATAYDGITTTRIPYIGRRSAGDYLGGIADHIVIWDRILDQTDAQRHALRRYPPE